MSVSCSTGCLVELTGCSGCVTEELGIVPGLAVDIDSCVVACGGTLEASVIVLAVVEDDVTSLVESLATACVDDDNSG